jgi:signal transduction histidine kinase
MEPPDVRYEQLRSLVRVTEKINAGKLPDEVLNHVFDSFADLVPYDRIGFSLIEPDGETARAVWARTRAREIKLAQGYRARLDETSLRRILESRRPRILNDLAAYAREHPGSASTRLIVEEGMRSSLTCPLVAAGQPIGFLFFSSMQPGVYSEEHVALIQEIAGQLALIVEKSRLYERLVELNVQKNALLGIAAHDLRGPIAVIQGFIEVLQEEVAGPITGKQQEVMAVIRRACGSMLTLIDNFLDISAIEAGRLELEPRDVELRGFLEECATTNRMLARAKSIVLELEIAHDVPPVVRFDPGRVNQVLNNLVGNAIKFSHVGKTITLSASVGGDALELAVADQGQGIPPDELPRLFSSFGRGSVRPTAGERSTGLGLAIVKRMVEAHGGSVAAESRVGLGSVFRVRLPLAPAAREPAPDASGPSAPLVAQESSR